MREPKAPQQLRAKRTRRQLLAAARQVFAERGYTGASIDDVAEVAGCSKGAYYFHFSSKEAILLALIEEWAEQRHTDLIEAVNTPRPAADALEQILTALFLSPGADGALVLEFWSQGERNQNVRRRLAQAEQSWRDFLIAVLLRVQDAGTLSSNITPASAADAVLALQRGFIAQGALHTNGKRSVHARVGTVLSLFVTPRQLRATG